MKRSLHIALLCAIALSVTAPSAFAQKIYWTQNEVGVHHIQRSNLDGSNVEDVLPNEFVSPVSVAVDPVNRKLYWGGGDDLNGAGIHCVNLAGGSEAGTIVLIPSAAVFGIAVDSLAGKIYWTERDFIEETGSIRSANLDGSNVEEVVSEGVQSPWGIAVDPYAQKVYWTDIEPGTVHRANLDGSNIELLLEAIDGVGNTSPISLDLRHRKIYWLGGYLFRANLDGTDVEMTTFDFDLPASFPGLIFEPVTQSIYVAAGWVFRSHPDGSGGEILVDDPFVAAQPGIAVDLGLPFPLLSDLARFQNCFTGAGAGSVDPDCIGLDFTSDNDVDLSDYVAFAAPILSR